jgi:hypothetical protein
MFAISTSLVNDLMSGALIMGYFVAALFFQKFYKTTRDRLFALFATAFWILTVQRLRSRHARSKIR